MFASKQALYVVVLQVFALQLIFASTSACQGIENVEISLNVHNASLIEVFSGIEARTNFAFVYNNEVRNITSRFSFSFSKVPVSEILLFVGQRESLKFKQINNNITVARQSGSVEYGSMQQSALRVAGRVTDKETGESIPGVSILLKGSNVGTTTDMDGNYNIDVSGDGAVLVFSYVGYMTQEIAVNDRSEIHIQMIFDARNLGEVIITALGIERDERNLGYAVEKVEGERLSENKTVNLSSALSGKIPGVDITNTANGVAGSKRVIIRGISSITGNNQPLWVVDGVPINTSSIGNATPSGGGGFDYGDGLTGLNADDIENITVLKGNAAAALYGSRASNGVILVNTKSGKDIDKNLSVAINSSLTLDEVVDFTDWQYEYGQGTRGNKPLNQTETLQAGNSGWGARMDGTPVVQFDGIARPYSPAKDNVKSFYRTGITRTNTASLLGNFDDHNFRISASNLGNRDVTPNASFDRNNLSVHSNSGFGKLSATVVLNYVDEKAENRQRIGGNYSNVNYTLIQLPTSVDVLDLQPGYDAFGKEIGIDNQGVITNPYFVTNKIYEVDRRRRVIASMDLKYEFTNWLYIKGRMMEDYLLFKKLDYTPSGVIWFPKGGGLNQNWRESNESNYELMIGSAFAVHDKLAFNGFIGGNIYKAATDIFTLDGSPFVIDGVYTSNNLANKYPSTNYIQSQTNSVFGMIELAYDDLLSVNFTGRKDWFSTLPTKNNSLFYPSVSVSYIFSDHVELPSWFNFGKLRGSFAQVSGGTDPYQLNLTYSLDRDQYRGINLQKVGNTLIPNTDLQPLLSSEYEIGLDLAFLNDRLDLNLSYYDRKTTQDIVQTDVSLATGFNRAVLNVGEMTNRGVEALVGYNVVDNETFSWDVTTSFSYNRNNVDYLGNTLSTIQIGASKTGSAFIHVEENHPYSAIKGFRHLRDENGQMVYDANGFPVRTPTTEIIGNGLYDKLLGIGNTFRWKGFSLYFLIDSKFGADIYSEQNSLAMSNGKHKMTLNGRETGVTGEGVTQTGEPNSVAVPVEKLNQYYGRIAGITENFVYDASFAKLRELSLGYRFPGEMLSKTPFKTASISMIGRNLFVLLKNTPNMDPESNTVSGNAQGISATVYPATRNVGINLNFTF